ncbi:MAG: EI24 domain-containing protein [Thermodesulfobacteriota bacterium]
MLHTHYLPSPFYVLRGARFIASHRELWRYAAAPLAMSLLLLGSSYIGAYYLLKNLFSRFTVETWYWQIVYYVLAVLAGLVVLVVFFFLITKAASALAGPFNDVLSQKTEALVTGGLTPATASSGHVLNDCLRSLGHSLKILGLYVAVIGCGLPLLLIPGVGSLLFSAVCVLLSSYMFAYEYLGYPMDRRRLSFKEKRAFLRSNLVSAMGFGLGNVSIAMIPFINLLLIPSAVAGGTLLYLHITRPPQRISTETAASSD